MQNKDIIICCHSRNVNAAPQVIWIMGLSGAGKTTLAKSLKFFLENKGNSVIHLDGDDLRKVLTISNSHFDWNNRKKLAFVYARLCELLANQGFSVICSAIGLFHELHNWNRENLPGYCEVFLNVPLDELRRRDPKGIYGGHGAGQIDNVVGLDVGYEFPKNPDIEIIHDELSTPEKNAQLIMDFLDRRTYS